MHLKQGYVQIYTGEGKGKTTAAVGLALRAAGAGLRVAMLHFLKNKYSAEDRLLKKIANVRVWKFGASGWVKGRGRAQDLAEAGRGLRVLKNILCCGEFDCVIADEACVAASLGLISEQALLACLEARPAKVELVLTGRGATRALKQQADLVTDMKAEKHYFNQGTAARRGIEF
jgi:cob(I)alamin adenosyltransferase